MLTPEEVMTKLGLDPWEERRKKTQAWREKTFRGQMPDEKMEQEKERMTGRTTRMFVSLLCTVSAGLRVYVKAGSFIHGVVLGRSAKCLAARLGLDDSLILLRPAPGAIEFQDHSLWDNS